MSRQISEGSFGAAIRSEAALRKVACVIAVVLGLVLTLGGGPARALGRQPARSDQLGGTEGRSCAALRAASVNPAYGACSLLLPSPFADSSRPRSVLATFVDQHRSEIGFGVDDRYSPSLAAASAESDLAIGLGAVRALSRLTTSEVRRWLIKALTLEAEIHEDTALTKHEKEGHGVNLSFFQGELGALLREAYESSNPCLPQNAGPFDCFLYIVAKHGLKQLIDAVAVQCLVLVLVDLIFPEATAADITDLTDNDEIILERDLSHVKDKVFNGKSGVWLVLRGEEGERLVAEWLTTCGYKVIGARITIVADGTRFVADLLVEDSSGAKAFVEVKTGDGVLSASQASGYPAAQAGDFEAYGANAKEAGLEVGGDPNDPVPYVVVRVPWVR